MTQAMTGSPKSRYLVQQVNYQSWHGDLIAALQDASKQSAVFRTSTITITHYAPNRAPLVVATYRLGRIVETGTPVTIPTDDTWRVWPFDGEG